MPQLLKPTRLEPVLHNKRSHHNEKPVHCNEDPTQPKIKIKKEKKFISRCTVVKMPNIENKEKISNATKEKT